ncbi:MAG: thiolase family protein [Chloroflexi bacterium]|nr:thiolase family protein [Chloroflexota bacterium]
MAGRERIAIISAVRTPIGRFGGTLKDLSAIELGALAAAEVVRRGGLGLEEIERVVAGENIQLTPRGNPARSVLLKAGIPNTSDDYTINMNCASGLRAMTSLAQDILMGDVHIGLAVGMENMSQTPYLLEGARWGYRIGDGALVDFLANYILGDAGPMAEAVAAKYGVTRQEQDEFAYFSQMKALAAIDAGKFAADILPVQVSQRKGPPLEFTTDEHPRRETTRESLARLKPAFRSDGTVTAGNSSGINDGAAALLLMSESEAGRRGLKPRGYLNAWAAAGVEPGLFGIGPVPATQKLLARTGMTLGDIGLVEINEAFASSTLAVIKELRLDPDRVNVNGGAISLGHPVGATGLILVIKMLAEMERRRVHYGLVTMCVGNGQGMSVILERE